jgi:hypothetical protein
MKVTQISVIAVLFLVIAIAVAGCTSSQTTTPAGSQATPAAGAASAGATPAAVSGSSSGSALAAGSTASASDLFGGLAYNWIEYRMTGGSADQKMTMYIKWDKSGKCTMRFEGAGTEGMPSSMDCSSTGGKAQSNPNDASSAPSDIRYVYVGPDVVTVPAGTFTADKYTVTSSGATSTFWIVKGKGMVKMVSNAGEGSSTMELNGMG